jgi:hypothetical protein
VLDVRVVPPPDEPALEDDTTARLFQVRVQCVRNQTWLLLTAAGGLVLVGWWWPTVPLLALALSACVLAGVWQTLSQAWQPSQRWIPAARRPSA